MLRSCRHFPACGGCQILDLEYAEQLAAKEEEVRRHFSDWPSLPIEPILPCLTIYGYRHKVQLPFGLDGRGREWKDMKRKALGSNAPAVLATIGCFAAGSHVVVDQDECLVQDEGLSQAAWAVRDWANAHAVPVYREDTGEGWLRHLLLRKGAGTGEILLGLVTNGPGSGPQELLPDLVQRIQAALAKDPSAGNQLVGVVQSLNTERTNVVLGREERLLWGRAHLKEILGTFTFSVGVSTFFQVNPFQTPRLYDLALAGIPAGAAVLDLYSGIGSIALWVSRRAGSVLGIEENPAAVEAARSAAEENGVANAEFLAADVADVLINGAAILRDGLRFDEHKFQAAVVDPPRKGLEAGVRDALCKLGLSRIIYVSCFPPTLARDARAMAGSYRLTSLTPVDMFPHTRHVECVAVFEAL
jgi:23S rRNA (uracil1939-C5)-methyltransferase